MASKSARLAEARCRSPSLSSVVDDDDSFDAFVLGALCDCLNCEPCFVKRRDDDDAFNTSLIIDLVRRISILVC